MQLWWAQEFMIKVYSETNRGEFPDDLADLSRRISSVIGYSNYKAEAAIVNYYPLSGNLSGCCKRILSNIHYSTWQPIAELQQSRVGLVNFVLVLLDFWRALIGLMLWH